MTIREWELGSWTLRRTLDNPTDWLPLDGYSDPGLGDPPLPEYEQLHVDRNGFLWVLAVVRDLRWQKVPPASVADQAEELFDARLEVIDPEDGSLIASYRHDGPSQPLPPFSRFLSDGSAYRVVEDSLGFRRIEIYDVYLSSR